MSADYQLRFSGISRLYGNTGADIIKHSHFCVIGIGGVGSWAAEALARSGVNEITLIDLDDICITNTNRQIHALQTSIGESKVEVMAERIKAINPDCTVHIIEDFVTDENLRALLTHSFDYVIEAIDSVKIKSAIIAHCKRIKLPIVVIGGAGGQIDPTQINVDDLSRTYQDPLLAKVKNQLRREYNFPRNTKRKFAIDAVYSTEQLVYPSSDGEVCQAKQSANTSSRLDCNTGFGSITHVTASFAFIAVSKALTKLITKKKRLQASQA